MDTISKVGALREYFGMKPGQQLADFAKEIKQLSPEEKDELANLAATALGKVIKEN